jgi:hypothetical protein
MTAHEARLKAHALDRRYDKGVTVLTSMCAGMDGDLLPIWDPAGAAAPPGPDPGSSSSAVGSWVAWISRSGRPESRISSCGPSHKTAKVSREESYSHAMCVRARQQDLSHLLPMEQKNLYMTAVVAHAGHAMPRKAQVAVATRRLRARHSTSCCPVTQKHVKNSLSLSSLRRVHLLAWEPR